MTPDQFFAGKAIGDRVVILDSDGYFMASSIAEAAGGPGPGGHDRHASSTPSHPMMDLTLEGMNFKRLMREKGIGERTGRWVERSLRPIMASRSRSTTTIATARAAPPNRQGSLSRAASATPSRFWSATRSSSAPRASRTPHSIEGLVARRGEWTDKGIEMVVRSGDCLAPRYLADAIFDGHRIAREFEKHQSGAAAGDHPRTADLGARSVPQDRRQGVFRDRQEQMS